MARHATELPERERSRHAQAVRQIREQRDRTLREAIERRDARIGAAQGRHARHTERMREQHREAIGKVQDLAENQLEEAQSQLEKALWMAETIYDSGEQGPRERYERTKAALHAAQESMRIAWASMETLARRSAHGAALRSAVPEPMATPSGATWSDIAREAVTAAQRAHAEMARARMLRLARPPVLAGLCIVTLSIGAALGLAVGSALDVSVPLPLIESVAVSRAIAGAGLAALLATAASVMLWSGAAATVRRCASAARGAREALEACATRTLAEAERTRTHEERAREKERDESVARAKARWNPVIERITRRRGELTGEFEAKYGGVATQLDAQREAEVTAAEQECAKALDAARKVHDEASAAEMAAHVATMRRLSHELTAMRTSASAAWRAAQAERSHRYGPSAVGKRVVARRWKRHRCRRCARGTRGHGACASAFDRRRGAHGHGLRVARGHAHRCRAAAVPCAAGAGIAAHRVGSRGARCGHRGAASGDAAAADVASRRKGPVPPA
jgi:hypothetical protein